MSKGNAPFTMGDDWKTRALEAREEMKTWREALRLPAELLNKIQAEIMEAVKKNAMTSPAVWWAIAASDSINAAHACGLKPHEIIEFHRDEIEKFCAAMEELPSTHDQHEAIQRSVRFWRGLLENGDTKSEGFDQEALVAGADVTAAGTTVTVFQRVRGSEYRYQPTNVVELVVSDAKDVAPFVDPSVESTLVSVEICEEAADVAYGEMRSRLKAASSRVADARVQLRYLGVALHDADGRPRAPMDISSDIKEKLVAITDSTMRAQVEKTLSPWINPIGPLFPGEPDRHFVGHMTSGLSMDVEVAGMDVTAEDVTVLIDGENWVVVGKSEYPPVGRHVAEQLAEALADAAAFDRDRGRALAALQTMEQRALTAERLLAERTVDERRVEVAAFNDSSGEARTVDQRNLAGEDTIEQRRKRWAETPPEDATLRDAKLRALFLGDATRRCAHAFNYLGIALHDSSGQRRPTANILMAFSGKLAEIADPTMREQLAVTLVEHLTCGVIEETIVAFDRELTYSKDRRAKLQRELCERSDECLALQDKIAKLIEARPAEARVDEPELFPANALRF